MFFLFCLSAAQEKHRACGKRKKPLFMAAKKKNVEDTSRDFLGIDEPKAESVEAVEIGVVREDLPDGYILKPEPKTEHLHLLLQKSIKTALTEEASNTGVSVNELIHRVLAERYRK